MLKGLIAGSLIAALVTACGGGDEIPRRQRLESAGDGGAQSVGVAGAPSVVVTRKEPLEASAGATSEAGSGGASGDVPAAVGGAPVLASGGAAQGGAPVISAGGSVSEAGGSLATAQGGSPVATAGAPSVPACACTSGECCDGCQLRPSTWRVAMHQEHWRKCAKLADPSGIFTRQYGDVYCSGSESGPGTQWVDTDYIIVSCPQNTLCLTAYPSGQQVCG